MSVWSWNLVILIVISFTNSFCYQMFNSTLALYVQDIMPGSSLTGTVAGIASMIFTVAIIFSRSFGAQLLETYGRKPVMIVGTLIFGLGSLVNAWIPTVSALLILRAIQGLGAGAASTCISIATIHVVPEERLSDGMGKASSGGTLAMIIGPAIALMTIAGGNYQIPFYCVFLCCCVTLIGSLLVTTYHDRMMRTRRREQRPQFRPGRLRDMICSEVLLPSSIQFMVMLSYASYTTYLTIFTEARGYQFSLLGMSAAGAFFAVASVVMVFTQFLFGGLGDKYGPIRVAIPGMALSILSFLLLASTDSTALYFVASVVYGIGSGLIMPVLNASTIKGAPEEKRSLASSTFYILYDAGLGLGALIWGVVRDVVGVTGIFVGAAITMMLAAVLTWYVFGRRRWLH